MRTKTKILAGTFGVAVIAGATLQAETATKNGAESLPSFLTNGVACDISHTDFNPSVGLESRYTWRCSGNERKLSGNGVPDHVVGRFPNSSNPNAISEQRVSISMPLTPTFGQQTARVNPRNARVYALNGVKFDPGTAGACPSSAKKKSHCSIARGNGPWRIEALGQNVFDFGEDMNNAHVQPSGEYHYHGIPEGILENAGVSDTNKKMLLVGWAADGFPVYARYCFADPMDATGDLKVCEGSYTLDKKADEGRPSTSWFPLGTFTSDWSYTEGAGDLDECNGRIGVTPEFPDGIYYYMATDSYPYFSRCIKGVFNASRNYPRHPPPHGRRPF